MLRSSLIASLALLSFTYLAASTEPAGTTLTLSGSIGAAPLPSGNADLAFNFFDPETRELVYRAVARISYLNGSYVATIPLANVVAGEYLVAASSLFATPQRADDVLPGQSGGAQSGEPDAAPNSYVRLQAATPGIQQVGHMNISGTGLFGRVGIGTTPSEQALQVNGGVLIHTGTGNLHMGFPGGNQWLFGTSGGGANLLLVEFATGATRLYFEAGGQVGVGTSAPAAKLHALNAATTGTVPAVQGDTSSGSSSAIGVLGQVTDTTPGGNSAGVRGINAGTASLGIGVYGSHATNGWGVFGTTPGGRGVYGSSTSGDGVVGASSTGNAGQFSTSSSANTNHAVTSATNATGTLLAAIHGDNNGGGFGVIGVVGSPSTVNIATLYRKGVWGDSNTDSGTQGTSSTINGVGTHCLANGGSSSAGVFGSFQGGGSGFAGFFDGDVDINGTLTKTAGAFKIDHPSDPANKYLVHSFVESPDMMNVYNGNVTTDANGTAVVALPTYFETLNRDFRYQLTVIGQFAQAVVSREVQNNTFEIRTDKPNVKVSWQVTGIRQDPWANANRIQVEPLKEDINIGRYLHPGLYGMPEDHGITWLTGRMPEFIPDVPGGAISVREYFREYFEAKARREAEAKKPQPDPNKQGG